MDLDLSSKKVEISEYELWFYKRYERNWKRINSDLMEYMGFDDEYLISDKGLGKYNKKDLITKIHQQRDVIRKLINELDPVKKDNYIAILEQIEKDDGV